MMIRIRRRDGVVQRYRVRNKDLLTRKEAEWEARTYIKTGGKKRKGLVINPMKEAQVAEALVYPGENSKYKSDVEIEDLTVRASWRDRTRRMSDTEFEIEETPENKKARLANGFKDVITIDADKFRHLWEQQQVERFGVEESLGWSDLRSAQLKELEKKDEKLDDMPKIELNRKGSIEFFDGRHRINTAAFAGKKIKVAVKDKEEFQKYYPGVIA